jgi:D-tyrosyl-tRNA(Tyr) deacylase
MRVIIQRVKSSQVEVAGAVVGKIGRGLNLLVGIADTDTEAELDWMARKCLDLRLFPGTDTSTDRWEKSVQEIGGELLVVSQFTLTVIAAKDAALPSLGQLPQNRHNSFTNNLSRSCGRVVCA